MFCFEVFLAKQRRATDRIVTRCRAILSLELFAYEGYSEGMGASNRQFENHNQGT